MRCQAVTFNNLALYYNRVGQPRSALKYLEQALEKERMLEDSSFRADTHLNICAVLSQMGHHDLALHHAQNAIVIIQSTLLFTFLPDTKRERKAQMKGAAAEVGEDGNIVLTAEKKEEMKLEFKERISILCVAYHNLGVQQEFMKMHTEALESYKMAT